ncbi:MAG TPA: carbohydrate ABC transporter permease [Desulfobacteria bacterium]|nr:carbohydrate ABC transporter permease [Desulfobacteria bacterium]
MNRSKIRGLLKELAILFLVLMFIFPLYWLVLTTIKLPVDSFKFPPEYFPHRITLKAYPHAWTMQPTGAYYRNTVIASSLSAILGLLLGIPAAYGAARFRFKGKDDIMFFILSTRFLPPVTAIIPIYMAFKFVGLLNNLAALVILYAGFNLPIIVWVLKSYFEEIPASMEESYMLDGHSRLKAFFRITLPLSLPGIVAVSVLSVTLSWGEFLFALILTFTKSAKTLPVGAAEFTGDIGVLWQEITVYGFLALIPMIIFILVVQKQLVRGLTMGALK